MGYQITFKPPKELVEKQLKSRSGDMSDNIRDLEMELLMYCLKPNEKDTGSNIGKLRHQLRMLYNMIRLQTYLDAVRRYEEDADGYIWYCGWNFADLECDWTLEETLANHVEDFLILKEIVPTPDWFDNQEKLYEKINSIKSTTEGYEEICQEIIIYEIMDLLRPYDVSNEPEEVSGEPDEYTTEEDLKAPADMKSEIEQEPEEPIDTSLDYPTLGRKAKVLTTVAESESDNK